MALLDSGRALQYLLVDTSFPDFTGKRTVTLSKMLGRIRTSGTVEVAVKAKAYDNDYLEKGEMPLQGLSG